MGVVHCSYLFFSPRGRGFFWLPFDCDAGLRLLRGLLDADHLLGGWEIGGAFFPLPFARRSGAEPPAGYSVILRYPGVGTLARGSATPAQVS
ncbi:MAG: hypothetical protein QXU69_08180, partial [Thermofilaceae archaeon]